MRDSLTEAQVRELLEHSIREGVRQCACAFSNSVADLCREWLALREQTRWVPVSERLPEVCADESRRFDVVVDGERHEAYFGTYYDEDEGEKVDWHWDVNEMEEWSVAADITHWQEISPLPTTVAIKEAGDE